MGDITTKEILEVVLAADGSQTNPKSFLGVEGGNDNRDCGCHEKSLSFFKNLTA